LAKETSIQAKMNEPAVFNAEASAFHSSLASGSFSALRSMGHAVGALRYACTGSSTGANKYQSSGTCFNADITGFDFAEILTPQSAQQWVSTMELKRSENDA
jgi:hypothetical protein